MSSRLECWLERLVQRAWSQLRGVDAPSPDAKTETCFDNFLLAKRKEADAQPQRQFVARESKGEYRQNGHDSLEEREPISDSFFERDAWRGIQQRRRLEAFKAFGKEPPYSPFYGGSRSHQEGFFLKIVARLLPEPSPVHPVEAPSPLVQDGADLGKTSPLGTRKPGGENSSSAQGAAAKKWVPPFLSADSDTQDAKVGEFPFFETENPVGRARVSPTHRQMRWKLGRIAKVAREERKRPLPDFRLDLGVVEFSFTRPTETALSQPNVVEAIEELEGFVQSQLDGEAEARYQEAIRARRW